MTVECSTGFDIISYYFRFDLLNYCMLDEAFGSPPASGSERSPLAVPSPEVNPAEKRFCLYISGVTGGKHTAEPIGAALKTVYGEEDVLAVPSIVSIDPQDRRKKYPDLAETLFKQMGEKKKVTIVAFSGGPIELVDLIAAMKAKNPNTEDWAKNLEIVLMSPAGIMRGARETLRFLGHLKSYAKGFFKDFPVIGALIKYPDSGIASFFLDPPDPKVLSAEDLENAVRIGMPERSQKDKSTESVPFDATDFRPDEKMTGYINEEVASAAKKGRDFKREKQELDTEIKAAVLSGDRKLITALLIKRGKLYAGPLKKAYDNPFNPETKNPLAIAKIYSQMLLGLAHFSKSAYTGKVVDTINGIREKGAGIFLITPELDQVFSLEDARNFEYAQELTGADDIRTLTAVTQGIDLTSHDSWVANPKILAAALRSLQQKKQG